MKSLNIINGINKIKRINKTNINLIAAIGKRYSFVKKKIKIGFYTSGDELTNLTENLKGTQINNSNFDSLIALLEDPYIENKYLFNYFCLLN